MASCSSRSIVNRLDRRLNCPCLAAWLAYVGRHRCTQGICQSQLHLHIFFLFSRQLTTNSMDVELNDCLTNSWFWDGMSNLQINKVAIFIPFWDGMMHTVQASKKIGACDTSIFCRLWNAPTKRFAFGFVFAIHFSHQPTIQEWKHTGLFHHLIHHQVPHFPVDEMLLTSSENKPSKSPTSFGELARPGIFATKRFTTGCFYPGRWRKKPEKKKPLE